MQWNFLIVIKIDQFQSQLTAVKKKSSEIFSCSLPLFTGISLLGPLFTAPVSKTYFNMLGNTHKY